MVKIGKTVCALVLVVLFIAACNNSDSIISENSAEQFSSEISATGDAFHSNEAEDNELLDFISDNWNTTYACDDSPEEHTSQSSSSESNEINSDNVNSSFIGQDGMELSLSDGFYIDDRWIKFNDAAYGYPIEDAGETNPDWYLIKTGDVFGDLRVTAANSTYYLYEHDNWRLESQNIVFEGQLTLNGMISYIPDGELPEYMTLGHELFFLPDYSTYSASKLPLCNSGTSYLYNAEGNIVESNDLPVFSLGKLNDYNSLCVLDNENNSRTIQATVVLENISFQCGLSPRVIATIAEVYE